MSLFTAFGLFCFAGAIILIIGLLKSKNVQPKEQPLTPEQLDELYAPRMGVVFVTFGGDVAIEEPLPADLAERTIAQLETEWKERQP